MNKTNTGLKLLATCLAIAAAVVFLCTAALSVGLVARYITVDNPFDTGIFARRGDSSNPSVPQTSTDTTTAVAEDFDVFWEALDFLEKHYDGEVPAGADVTYAAAEAVMNWAGTCDPTDEEATAPSYQFDSPETPRDAPDNFAFFWQTVNQVYRDCAGSAPAPEQLVYIAVNGVIERLDSNYTNLLSPEHAGDYRIDLDSSFEGIGATVGPTDQESGTGVRVVYPLPGSPAERNGLLQGDEIVAVDGSDVTTMNLDDAVLLIRGPSGSVVVLTVNRREIPPFDVEVTRDQIDIPIIEWEIRDDNLLYIALYDFSPRAEAEMRSALQTGLDENVDGLILDLRGNPGGLLDISIAIASMFVEEGVIVSESGRRDIEHHATDDAILPTLPMVVLIDAGSASASEIVAAAIQDHDRGLLVGEKTFGKGSVQTLFTLSNGSLLRVTTSRWFTPQGRQIEGEGLLPDIAIPFGTDPNVDPQLDAALEQLHRQITD